MAEDLQQAKDEIAYIRRFLGSSGPVPLGVGHFYLLIGVVFFLYASRQFCLDMGWELPGFLTAYRPWDTLSLFLIGFGISSPIMWRQQKKLIPENLQDLKLNPGARAAQSAWNAVSIAVTVGAFSLWLSSGVEELLVAGMILLAVCYSVGWSVTHTVHRVRWHKAVAYGFIGWAIAIGSAAGTTSLTLVIAVGLLTLFAVPGYRIIREAGAVHRADSRL